MKKTFTSFFLIVAVLVGTSAFVLNKTGMAGHTGSPGEPNCSHCHGGGTTASKSISISAIPSFTTGQYWPDTIYSVSVTVNAAGFNAFGFGCEVLNSSNADIGLLQNAGAGVQFLIGAGKNNATHTTPKVGTNSATFTFKWKAPTAGEGEAKFYVCGNAVNSNNQTTGDVVVPGTPLTLAEGTVAVVQPTTSTGVSENSASLRQMVVYPNPSSGFSTVSYSLKQNALISVDIIDIGGKHVKQVLSENEAPGYHSHILNLSTIPAGVYFIKASDNGRAVSQKLITIN